MENIIARKMTIMRGNFAGSFPKNGNCLLLFIEILFDLRHSVRLLYSKRAA